jgi:hypothetical protein
MLPPEQKSFFKNSVVEQQTDPDVTGCMAGRTLPVEIMEIPAKGMLQENYKADANKKASR